VVEPLAGIRRRYALPWNFEAYGQAALSIPYMRASFESRSRTVRYDAFFPVLAPSLGMNYFPVDYEEGQFGASVDLGYTTPAFLNFRRNGADVGDVKYGGITYGFFLVYRPNPHPPVPEIPVAVAPPKKRKRRKERIDAGPVAPSASGVEPGQPAVETPGATTGTTVPATSSPEVQP
jgi:hypothetical protein